MKNTSLKQILIFIKQLFCIHKYERVSKDEGSIPQGGILIQTRAHICTHCEKETSISSGLILT